MYGDLVMDSVPDKVKMLSCNFWRHFHMPKVSDESSVFQHFLI